MHFSERIMSARGPFLIGKVFGFDVRLHPSLVIVFALVVIGLGAGAFPAWHPNWSASLIWLTALGAAVLFFMSVLAHELSHALVARGFGLRVHSITLFLFGGIANIEDDCDTPTHEAVMAGVGPLVSIALGVAFTALASVLTAASVGSMSDPELAFRHAGPLATLAGWLGPVNIVIGLFNLLPGYPLDGGRILRATAWAVTGDLVAATRLASRAGQALGTLFVLAGFAMALGLRLPLLGTGFSAGLWLALIGWFLNSAARSSYERVRLRGVLEHVSVQQLMRRLPPAINADADVSTLVRDFILPSAEDVVPVVSSGRIVGLVRVEDVGALDRNEWPERRVAQVCRSFDTLPVLAPSQTAYDAIRLLSGSSEKDLGVVPVVRDGTIVGLVGRHELERWLQLDSHGRPRNVGVPMPG